MSNKWQNKLWQIEQNNTSEHINSKNELKYLSLQIELNNLNEKTINKSLQDIAPNYFNEIKNKHLEEKKELLAIFLVAKRILWNNFVDYFLKWKKFNKVPLIEIQYFITELLNIESQKDIEMATEIILTEDELEQLHKILIISDQNKKVNTLREFITEQLNENITSAEIVKWTLLEQKLKKEWKHPIEYMKNLDSLWYTYLIWELPSLSEDTIRNMASW